MRNVCPGRVAQRIGIADGPGKLNRPFDVHVDKEGMMFVADTDRVVVYDEDGKFVRHMRHEKIPSRPRWMSICANERDRQVVVLTSDNEGYSNIFIFSKDGTFIREWCLSDFCMDVEFDNVNGMIIVACHRRVLCFDCDGKEITEIKELKTSYSCLDQRITFSKVSVYLYR